MGCFSRSIALIHLHFYNYSFSVCVYIYIYIYECNACTKHGHDKVWRGGRDYVCVCVSVCARLFGRASFSCSSDGLDEGVVWQSGVAIAFCFCFLKAIRQRLASPIKFLLEPPIYWEGLSTKCGNNCFGILSPILLWEVTWISASHNMMLAEIMYLFISTSFKISEHIIAVYIIFGFYQYRLFIRPMQSIYVKGLYVYILQYLRISFAGSLCVYVLAHALPFPQSLPNTPTNYKNVFLQTSSVWKRSCSCLCNLSLHKEREDQTRQNRADIQNHDTDTTLPTHPPLKGEEKPPPTHLLRSPTQNHPPKTNKRQNTRTQTTAAHTLSLKGLKSHPP